MEMTDPSMLQPEDEEAARQDAIQRQRHAIETLIADRLKDAVDARQQSGIEQVWLEDEDQYNGIDEWGAPANIPPGYPTRRGVQPNDVKGGNRSRAFLNITKPKTDTAISRVQEMLLPHDDKPWEIEPTPIPEFKDAADGRDDRMLTLADGAQAPASKVAKALILKAEEASGLMATQIEDWFVEGSVYAEMRRTIKDAGRIGTGVLKGPFPKMKRRKSWRVDGSAAMLEMTEALVPGSKAISAWDLFPDPSCGESIDDGAYIFERDYMTARRLRELAALPEYDTDALAEIVKEGPRKRSRYDDRDSREYPGQNESLTSETFEVWYYYGDIPPEQLIAGGFVVVGLNDSEDPAGLAEQVDKALQLTTVPIVATMVNDRVIRVSLNQLETGEFPFSVFTWEPVVNQVWGRGIPRKMAVAQRGLNSAVRAMLENAGMSAGPQVVIDRDRIEPANGVYEISGRSLWYWRPGEEVKDVRFAFASVMIDSAQAQLQAIIEFFLRMADELSALPMLLQGIVGSQAPETMGGQAMAVANATSPLRAIAKQFDDQLVVPHLRRYYDWGMQDQTVKPEAKGDMQVRARGASVLVYRDVAAQFLPQLAPMVKDPAFKLNPEKWMAEVLRGAKVNPTSIQYTEDESKAIQDAQAQQQQPADPRIEAAQINAQAKAEDRKASVALKQAELQHDAQQAALDRMFSKYVEDVELAIQSLEFAGQRDISLAEIKAMLAAKSMSIRNDRDLFVAEKQFAETTGEGRGL